MTLSVEYTQTSDQREERGEKMRGWWVMLGVLSPALAQVSQDGEVGQADRRSASAQPQNGNGKRRG